MDKIVFFPIVVSIILLILCSILFVLLKYVTKIYYKELNTSAKNIINKYIFTEFFKQITGFLSKETIIVCLENAIKICENNDLIQFDVFPKDASSNIKIENVDKYNIAAKGLYKQYTKSNTNYDEEGDC